MPIRFHRQFTLFPGVKVNVSKTGMSITIGGKGFHLNFSKRGVMQTTNLPGKGLFRLRPDYPVLHLFWRECSRAASTKSGYKLFKYIDPMGTASGALKSSESSPGIKIKETLR